MKKMLALLLVVMFLLAGCGQESMATHECEGVAFEIPANWVDESPYFYDQAGGMLMVSTSDAPSYGSITDSENADNFISGFTESAIDPEVTSIDEIEILNNPALRFKYSAVFSSDSDRQDCTCTAFILNEKVYIFVYIGKQAKAYESILASIKKVNQPSEGKLDNTIAPLEATPEPAQTAEPEPQLDKTLSESLNTMMFESFGGSGNAEFATSWYPFIDTLQVYSLGDEYYSTLTLTEEVADTTMRAISTAFYFSKENTDLVIPVVLDAGAYLDLDEAEMCLIVEGLSKILNASSGSILPYESLQALGIPVYEYLSSALDSSESTIKKNIDLVYGSKAADIILAGMKNNYQDSFNGITEETAEKISYAALANFDDVYLEKMIVCNPDGEQMIEFENRKSK